jgi:hypothetical protein
VLSPDLAKHPQHRQAGVAVAHDQHVDRRGRLAGTIGWRRRPYLRRASHAPTVPGGAAGSIDPRTDNQRPEGVWDRAVAIAPIDPRRTVLYVSPLAATVARRSPRPAGDGADDRRQGAANSMESASATSISVRRADAAAGSR